MGIRFCRKKPPTAASVPALELRIHGVHGTSPASMLGIEQSDAKQVAGDGLTGVFRSDKPLPYRKLNTDTAVEAYSWGDLTSNVKGVFGWVQRALWMSLLPFALVNLAYWARLHVGDQEKRGRWGATTVRWAGLLITMLFVLTASLIAVDMVAWQCYRGGTKGCDVLPGALDFMMRLAPSQRIAVGALVPLAVVLVLWFLSRQSLARYERTRDTATVTYSGGGQLLQRPQFWEAAPQNESRTHRLQRLHVSGAIATVMAYVGVQVDNRQYHTDPPQSGAVGVWTWVAIAVLVMVFIALMFTQPGDVEHPDGVDRSRPAWAAHVVARVLIFATPALAVMQGWSLTYGDVGEQSRRWATDDSWRGHNAWFIGVFLALTVLNIALFVGGRMRPPWATLTIILFAMGAFPVVTLSLQDAKLPSLVEQVNEFVQDRIEISFTLAGIFMVALLGWYLWQRKDRPTQAWGGGSAAMLVGASAWVALLFTTAAVTAAADYLNGPDQSVAALASRDGSPKLPGGTSSTGEDIAPVVDLGKDVVLRGAVVTVSADGVPPLERLAPVLTRGTVETAKAYIDATDPARARKVPDVVLGSGSLILEDETVELVASCLLKTSAKREKDAAKAARAAPACLPESAGYRPRVSIKVPGQQITVIAPGRHVRLMVDDPPRAPMIIPQVLIWTPISQLVWAILVAAVIVACVLRLRFSVYGRINRQVRRDSRVPNDCKPAAVRKRFVAALAHRSERFIEFFGMVTVLVVLALLVLTCRGEPPWGYESTGTGLWVNLAHPIATASLYVSLGLSAALIALGSYFRRSESARKAVGVIWDLTTFWPRAAHPLSPPCYAERVVPELTTRIRWALEKDPNALVIVSGHSQGSLIAAATLVRLQDSELRRVRFITYGSQIRALYGRVFPSVFGDTVIGYRKTPSAPRFKDAFPDVTKCCTPGPPRFSPDASLRARIGEDNWVNLFRRTDPLGYRVFSDADSAWDVPVAEVPPHGAGDPGPPVMTHSGYQHTFEYRTRVGGWLLETVVPDQPNGPAEYRPLPHP